VQEDREGEFYYIMIKLPEHMGRSSRVEGACSSSGEVVHNVVIAASGTVKWKE
jgi:hypothetical protein